MLATIVKANKLLNNIVLKILKLPFKLCKEYFLKKKEHVTQIATNNMNSSMYFGRYILVVPDFIQIHARNAAKSITISAIKKICDFAFTALFLYLT